MLNHFFRVFFIYAIKNIGRIQKGVKITASFRQHLSWLLIFHKTYFFNILLSDLNSYTVLSEHNNNLSVFHKFWMIKRFSLVLIPKKIYRWTVNEKYKRRSIILESVSTIYEMLRREMFQYEKFMRLSLFQLFNFQFFSPKNPIKSFIHRGFEKFVSGTRDSIISFFFVVVVRSLL
jgi:hypothetical protein